MGLRITLFLVFLVLAAGRLEAQKTYPPPYVPTPMGLVNAMLELGGLQPGDVVYDLGSGDGRIVVTAAQRGARGVGIEYEPSLVERSLALADSAGVTDSVDFRSEDLFATDLHDASLVTLYLSHAFNMRLRPRLLDQLEPGSRVVSHGFHMGEWAPDSTVTIGTGVERATLYSWIVPESVDGFWYLDIERTQGVRLELRQRFQRLDGAVSRADRALDLVDGEVRGEEIRFEVVERAGGRDLPLVFTGKLTADRMVGVVTGPADWGTRQWSAVRFSDEALAPDPPQYFRTAATPK